MRCHSPCEQYPIIPYLCQESSIEKRQAEARVLQLLCFKSHQGRSRQLSAGCVVR